MTRKTHPVDVRRLHFDRRNPRLVASAVGDSDEQIIATLYRVSDVRELLHSISANGYLDIEPMVVMPENENDKLTVLEGNRRLAAIQLFLDPTISERIKSSYRLAINVPNLAKHLRNSLRQITVYEVSHRAAARSFIGFKHINGTAKWDSYAKARFAADWYKSEHADGVTLHDIANQIGDSHNTIKRMVSAIYILDQAHEQEVYDINDRSPPKFNFSHLYTALARSEYMKYLGITYKWSSFDPTPNPISESNIVHLQEILTWIYGSKSNALRAVVRVQNPDIRVLGKVLSSKEALHALRASHNLDYAHQYVTTVDTRFTTAIFATRRSILDAVANLRAYDGSDRSLLNVSEDIRENSETLHNRMRRKYREKQAQ